MCLCVIHSDTMVEVRDKRLSVGCLDAYVCVCLLVRERVRARSRQSHSGSEQAVAVP